MELMWSHFAPTRITTIKNNRPSQSASIRKRIIETAQQTNEADKRYHVRQAFPPALPFFLP